jgi:hypothetical protein
MRAALTGGRKGKAGENQAPRNRELEAALKALWKK